MPTESKPHVLIVDDDPAIRESLTAALAGAYVVHAAATGDGACALLRSHPVAAIVLDAILGEEQGLDLIQKIRALSPAPILILTGHGSEDLATRALRARVSDYLKKPVSLAEIRGALARVRTTRLRVEQIAQAVGYARVTTFDRIFKRAFRRTPSAYRQGVKSGWASSQGEKSGSAL